MTANPFAALLDGVPRWSMIEGTQRTFMARTTGGEYLHVSEVLAALAAADPALLAEAGKVLRYMIDNACGAAEIKGNKLVIVCTNEEWEAHVAATNAARAFLDKLENSHE